jgi:cell shape-determining protein MreC
LYSSTLANFRQQLATGRLEAVAAGAQQQHRRTQATERQRQTRELARLQRENERLRAIIDVQKKLSELLSMPLETTLPETVRRNGRHD